MPLSPNSATVAVFWPFSATIALSTTVADFGDSVDRALQCKKRLQGNEFFVRNIQIYFFSPTKQICNVLMLVSEEWLLKNPRSKTRAIETK